MAKKQEENCYPPRAVLEDGTEVRLIPVERTGRPLYASRDGHVYSWHRTAFRQLKPQYATYPCSKANGRRKQRYLKMTDRYAYIYAHHAVLYAWVGPCPKGFECDHLNGITTDNRLENLEWVTPEENRRRAVALRKQKKASSITS